MTLDADTEKLLTELEAFTTPDNGELVLAKFQRYLSLRAWNQCSGGNGTMLMRDGVIIQLPPQIKTRADLLQIARVIETVAKFEVRYRSDTWRDVLSVSLTLAPVINPWSNA